MGLVTPVSRPAPHALLHGVALEQPVEGGEVMGDELVVSRHRGGLEGGLHGKSSVPRVERPIGELETRGAREVTPAPEPAQREAAQLLAALVGAQQLVEEGAVAPLEELLSQQNRALRHWAGTVLREEGCGQLRASSTVLAVAAWRSQRSSVATSVQVSMLWR